MREVETVERRRQSASDRAHAVSRDSILDLLTVSAQQGLSAAEAKKRLHAYGRNDLRQVRTRGALAILLGQFDSIIVWLLSAAAGLSFYFREWSQGIAILVVLVLNSAIGFATEIKATRSMEALRRLSRVHSKVKRNGAIIEVPADEIVPGDIVVLDAGDMVTADLRLLEAANLQCDESTLTGESVPVAKSTEPIDADAPLAERRNMAFKGTAISTGSGAGVVVATGMASQLGRISALSQEARATHVLSGRSRGEEPPTCPARPSQIERTPD